LTQQPNEGISKLDESFFEAARARASRISNPKSEISDWISHHGQSNLRFRISDLRCRIRPISKFLICVLLLLLAACGRVGDPQPPFIRIPEAVKDLAATQNGNNIVLTWTNPPRYIDGSAATNLARVQIRSNGAPLTTLEAEAAGKPQSYAIPSGSMVNGERTFTIVVETSQGKLSDVSNTASILPVEVPGRVTRLTGLADQRRIFLRWDKPEDHPEFADAYVVTRSDIPAEAETVADTRYEDIRYQAGKSFTYQVTPLRRLAGNVIMGVSSEPVTVVAQDKTPPMVPTGLEVTQSDTGAYLTWQPNGETDLAGYRVFRSEQQDGGFKSLSDRLIMTNGFFDPAYRPGLYYAISAVDEFANESAMSAPFRGP
jgi:hypothetical protein